VLDPTRKALGAFLRRQRELSGDRFVRVGRAGAFGVRGKIAEERLDELVVGGNGHGYSNSLEDWAASRSTLSRLR
jgi:hypothetical protein